MNGRKPVVFDRAIRPDWIDTALDRFLSGISEPELRRELESMLAAKGLDINTTQKSARQLIRLVGHKTVHSRQRLVNDYELMASMGPDDRNAIRLQLIYDASPFFADCVKAIRNLNLNGKDGVYAAELYERLQSAYGHRGTIPRRVRNVCQTLASFGCLANEDRTWRTIGGSWLSCRMENPAAESRRRGVQPELF